MTYRKGQLGESLTVPGLQSHDEAPLHPDLTIDTTKVPAKEAAEKIVELVTDKFIGR
jgi:adenylylsulfate kinase-like enzyme